MGKAILVGTYTVNGQAHTISVVEFYATRFTAIVTGSLAGGQIEPSAGDGVVSELMMWTEPNDPTSHNQLFITEKGAYSFDCCATVLTFTHSAGGTPNATLHLVPEQRP